VQDFCLVQPTSVPQSGPRADPVRRAAQERPDFPALIAGDTTLTWAELDARVDATTRRLRATVAADNNGPGPGYPARIAIVLGNGIDFAVTYFAVLRAGLVAVPLNPGYTADELRHALTDSGATLAVATDAVRSRLGAVPLPVVAADELAEVAADVLAEAEPGDAPPPVAADALALLLYTSGTGGRPKAAMLSHAALAANHDQLARIDPPVIGPDDVALLAMPFFHAYGLNTGLGAVAHHGACGVIVDQFDPAGSLALIARHRITVAIGVPSMYAAWSRLPQTADAVVTVRTAVCGAAPLDPADAARFTALTGRQILIGYGLTETAPVLTTTAVSVIGKPGSIGRPLPGVELLLRTADGQVLWRDGVVAARDDSAEELDLGESPGTDPGEIVVRGANLFAGYWPDGHGGPDADGWWGTGDIAWADGDGDLCLVDRIGELILVNGFNVYPAEVERVLDEHPGVAEAAVVGVPHPATGQSVRAYVVPTGVPAPTAEELLRHCAGLLARFKVPASIVVVPELPHSATGKVRKTLLRSTQVPS
jgi:long-chain acyl-CoA synthetase